MTITPSPLDVMSAMLTQRLGELHVCMPAEVLRVHTGEHKRQFVDVLPGLQRQAFDVDGEILDETLPVLFMVPVAYMQGGDFFISVPLKAGDIVTLMFAERSLDQWLQTARKESKRAVIPGDVGAHPLEGAIALPCGPAPRTELLEGVDAFDLVIGGPSGVLARFTRDGDVILAEGADDAASAQKVAAELATIKHDIAALQLELSAGLGAVTTPGGAEAIVTARAGAVTAAATLPPWTGSVASGHVRVG